jgi:hypothetical protein
MAVSLPGRFSDLRVAGAYLPGLLLLAVWHSTREDPLLALGLGSLVGVVMVHGGIRAVFGPKGPEGNPLARSTSLQRMLVLLTTVGPAKQFADNLLDVFLNGQTYWGLISRGRKVLFGAHLLGLAVWVVSVFVALTQVWGALDVLPTSVLLLTVLLVIWVLQQFVLWRFNPSVHIIERDPSSHYIGMYVIDDRSEDAAGPDRPCEWMQLDDTVILEALARKQYSVTPMCVAAYVTAMKQKPPVELTPLSDGRDSVRRLSVLLSFLNDVEEVETRLQELSERGLVNDQGLNLYTISVTGKAFLSGEASASMFE